MKINIIAHLGWWRWWWRNLCERQSFPSANSSLVFPEQRSRQRSLKLNVSSHASWSIFGFFHPPTSENGKTCWATLPLKELVYIKSLPGGFFSPLGRSRLQLLCVIYVKRLPLEAKFRKLPSSIGIKNLHKQQVWLQMTIGCSLTSANQVNILPRLV